LREYNSRVIAYASNAVSLAYAGLLEELDRDVVRNPDFALVVNPEIKSLRDKLRDEIQNGLQPKEPWSLWPGR
jgi:hypothetical protein